MHGNELTLKRPWLFLAKKHVFKKNIIDGNEYKLFRSQPYNLVVDLLYVMWTKIWVMKPHRLRDHNVIVLKTDYKISSFSL